VILRSYVISSGHDVNGVLFWQFRFPFGSKLSKSVFNVGVRSD
jgi:hypothetical protein